SRKPTQPLHSAQTPSNTTMASPAAGSGGLVAFKPALVTDQPAAQRQCRLDLEGVAPFRLALAAVHAVEQRRRQRQHAEQLHAVDAPPQFAVLRVQREAEAHRAESLDQHAAVAAQARTHALAAEIALPGLAARARVEIDRDRYVIARLRQAGHHRTQPPQRIAAARDRRPAGVAE